MRFISLFSYSIRKSPKKLRLAIFCCRMVLILTVLALIFFLVGVIAHLNRTSVDNTIANDQSNQTESKLNDELQNDSSTTGISGQHDSNIHWLTIDFTVLTCLLLGLLMIIFTLISLMISLMAYRNYHHKRMECYDIVNRSFDLIELKQTEMKKIRDPIIPDNCDGNIHNQDDLENQNNSSSMKNAQNTNHVTRIKVIGGKKISINPNLPSKNKFSFWSRNQISKQSKYQPIPMAKKKMTI